MSEPIARVKLSMGAYCLIVNGVVVAVSESTCYDGDICQGEPCDKHLARKGFVVHKWNRRLLEKAAAKINREDKA